MNWAELVNEIMRDFRLSEPELASLMGITYPTLNRISRGETTTPNQNTIKKLERALNIRIDDRDPENLSYKKIETKFEGTITTTHYPILSEVYAGEPDKIDIEFSGNVKEPFTYYREEHRCFALRVNGHSMDTTLSDGDIVLVDMDLVPINGDLVVVKLQNGNQYIKRYYKYNDFIIQLTSDNPEYGVRLIDTKDIAAIHPVVSINFNVRNGARKGYLNNHSN